ncbi:RNA polymerase sigma factor [Dinghuibacter silviterrae]|nr:sigma-70 family RNA polymerase sigma factor [Dinghuibacter silviterrae]
MPENRPSPGQATVLRFEKIYGETFYRLEIFVRSFIKREEGVHDILQETYIRLWANLDKLSDDEALLPLLRTYATNLMINALRKSAKEQQRARLFYERQELPLSPDDALDYKQTLEAYAQAVETLPGKRKEIYRLVEDEGLSYKETAERMNLSPHAIRYHLVEARRLLARELSVDKLALAVLIAEIYRAS